MQGRLEQVVVSRQVGGEGGFRSSSGNVDLREGSNVRKRGDDPAGPIVDGKGARHSVRNDGHPGQWRVEPPLVEPA